MATEEEIIIHLFPNTGHHYQFIPGEAAETVTEAWNHPKNEPWLLCRKGKNADGGDGVWICVETNQGGASRSVFLDFGSEGKGEAPADSKSPYVAKSSSVNLPTGMTNSSVVKGKTLRFDWQRAAGEDPTDVDLVVDFGNTRTSVIALERREVKGRDKLADCCKPLVFLRRGEEFEGESLEEKKNEDLSRKIVDSWFVLRETEFAALREDPAFTLALHERGEIEKKGFFGKKKVPVWKEKKATPQMFVEVSPTIMGPESEERLRQANMERGDFFTMSSPKRFLWDDEVTVGRGGNVEWSMLDRRQDSEVKPLSGEICRYTYENGRDWDLASPPFLAPRDRPTVNPRHPGFPRRETMVWAALNILETAFREITSYKWREFDVRGITRRLKTVSLTFPSGWVADELRAYERAWNRAADIFALAHFPDAKAERPEVKLEVDEAVASQLPYVYSEIQNLRGDVSKWIETVGKGESVKVMTIDIGGGTMDVSVVEYRDRCAGEGIDGSHLEYRLLFRDCNTNAGDNAVKLIIERLLLPKLFECCDSLVGDDEKKREFRDLFSSTPTQAAERETRSRIVKLAFVPVVRKWLTCLGKGNTKAIEDENGEPLSFADLVGEDARNVLEDLKKILEEKFGDDVLDENKVVDYDETEIKKCIEEALRPGIAPVARFVQEQDVDVVTVSGKISEIPVVRELTQKLLPIEASRIVPMRKYRAGPWYPMAKGGVISDAKTVTVVGAALLRALNNRLLHNGDWTIRRVGSAKARPNFWGVIPPDPRVLGFQKNRCLLGPEEEEGEESFVRVGCRIGRMSVLSASVRPEKVYELRWRDKAKREQEKNDIERVRVSLRRRDSDYGEALEIASARDEEGNPIDGLELKLCTMEKERFWVDEGCFDIRFEDEE